ncbi:MAG: GDSL-type esterase/lipase family protein [Bacteroidota bacterium]
MLHRLLFLIRRYIGRTFFLVCVFLAGFATFSGSRVEAGHRVAKPAGGPGIPRQADTAYFPFINYNLNYIQFFERGSIENFLTKWKQAGVRKLSIVHFGDSHVQSDAFPGEVRNILQPHLGYGGRGMVFPYSAASSYSSIYYKPTHFGKWEFSKAYQPTITLPLGVSGMTIRTYDSTAHFSITFNEKQPDDYLTLKIFCRRDSSCYDFILRTGGDPIRINTDSAVYKDKPYIEVLLPVLNNSITLQLVESDTAQKQFEFYGMSLESTANKGLIVHSVGVGAAQYRAILRQELVEQQLPALNPDLVIIDYGTNDHLYKDMIPPGLEDTIRKVIQKVRKAAPNADILLTSTMDMFYKKKGTKYTYKNIRSGMDFSDLVRKIAREEKCAFWDWYWVSGGRGMMLYFRDNNLGQPDMIHLTVKGYKLKGKLLCDALSGTLDMLDKNPFLDSLVFSVDSLKIKQSGEDSLKKDTYSAPNNQKVYYHQIKSGESLSVIAKKYGVTVSQIMAWNGLKNSKIKAGNTLIIYAKKK